MVNIVWSENVDVDSIPKVGGKGANLGEMANEQLPVPESFIITGDAFWKFVKETRIKDKINNILTGLDVNDNASLKRVSNRVRELFNKANIPLDLEVDVLNAYKELSESAGKKEEFVAVRSSVTVKDVPDTFFVGLLETYLNVHSEKDLLDKIKKCWSSLFTPGAIAYIEKQKFSHNQVAVAVIVQRMVHSEVSGVMYTSEPGAITPTIMIKAGLGLGEAVVTGEIMPDTYYVNQKDMNIKNKIVQKQTWKYTKNEKGNFIKARVSPGKQSTQKLPNKQVVEVAMLGKRIEDHFKKPMEVEWCVEDNKVYIVQAQPLTKIKGDFKVEQDTKFDLFDIKVEGVEVSDMTESRKISSEDNVPIEIITAGDGVPVTGTRIMINLDDPEAVEEYRKLPVQGVGLLREEFIYKNIINHHPKALIDRKETKKLIDSLADEVGKVAKAFSPRPVILCTNDLQAKEYRKLEGGVRYESEEANPVIGWRGGSRYTSDEYEEAFRLELRAIKKVRTELGLKNLWVMLPFVRSVDECEEVIDMMDDEGLESGPDLKIWVRVDVTSNIFLADRFAELVDGFAIEPDILTQLIMGADRSSAKLGDLDYFDDRNPAFTRAIAQLIKGAHENKCSVSICSQTSSVHPEFIEFLVKHGIDIISLDPENVNDAIRLVASVEKKVMMERLAKLSSEE